MHLQTTVADIMAMDLPAAVSLDDHTSSHLIEAYFADCSRRFKLIAAPAWMDGINCTTDFKAKPDVWQRFFKVVEGGVMEHKVMPVLRTRDNFATLEFDGKRKVPSELADGACSRRFPVGSRGGAQRCGRSSTPGRW